MRPLVPLLILGALALPLALAPTASAWPPVCLERHADVAGVRVEVWITCGPGVTVDACAVTGDPCEPVTVGNEH